MVPVRRTQTWLPDIFNDFFDNTWMEKTNATAPAINIRETETNYEIEVAAPGMTREDFTIKIENNNQLVVSMEKKHEQKEDKKEEGRYLRREFSYTRFQQAMILPDDVVKEKIQARMLYIFPNLKDAVRHTRSPERRLHMLLKLQWLTLKSLATE